MKLREYPNYKVLIMDILERDTYGLSVKDVHEYLSTKSKWHTCDIFNEPPSGDEAKYARNALYFGMYTGYKNDALLRSFEQYYTTINKLQWYSDVVVGKHNNANKGY